MAAVRGKDPDSPVRVLARESGEVGFTVNPGPLQAPASRSHPEGEVPGVSLRRPLREEHPQALGIGILAQNFDKAALSQGLKSMAIR